MLSNGATLTSDSVPILVWSANSATSCVARSIACLTLASAMLVLESPKSRLKPVPAMNALSAANRERLPPRRGRSTSGSRYGSRRR